MPALCSALAAVISCMISATWRTLATTSSIVLPASCTSLEPISTCSTESPIRVLISLAAWLDLCARLRTSDATTAKPRPSSPALAASTAAFKARILVWKAMLSMTLIMSTILREEALIDSIVCTTCPTTAPPLPATSDAAPASALAWRALSAFWRTAEVSCSIEDAVSSSELACSSVRDDRSRLPWAISLEAVWMVSVPERTWLTMPTSLSRMVFMANSRLALSWLAVRISTVRSPSAMAPAILTAYAGSPPSWRVSPRVISAPSASPAAMLPSTSASMKLRLA